MHDFKYVPKSEWKPIRNELLQIIHELQNEVRNEFTFQYRFVGSSQRKMITRDYKSNTGFDFDVNIEVHDPDENYTPKEIRDILRNGLDNVILRNSLNYILWRYAYDFAEDSTRVLTIKVKDNQNSCILHSCDFCITYECDNGQQQYIRYNKKQYSYSWEYQPKGYTQLPDKIDWIKNNELWQQVRELYIDKKNSNNDNNKKSQSIFAETIHQVCQKNGYYKNYIKSISSKK